MARRLAPEVNAGSMADIAFLLLIFFLVSTTIQTDYGLSRTLPPALPDKTPPEIIREKNLFRVEINQFNELLVDNKPLELKDLKTTVIAFLDNGGGKGNDYCDYCKGKRDFKSSDHPTKAVISLINSRETNYETYIGVHNELAAAYNFLLDREAKRAYGMSFSEMKLHINDATYSGNKTVLQERIHKIQSMYPEKLSESTPVQATL